MQLSNNHSRTRPRFSLPTSSASSRFNTWVWPLPRLSGRTPTVTPSSQSRLAIDVGYDDHDFGGPLFVPVFAAFDGVIDFAAKTATGHSVILDHGGAWMTHYGSLDHMFAVPTERRGRRRRRETVRAGDVLGYAARAPVHVHFELWQHGDHGFEPVDPVEHMAQWLVLPTNDRPRKPAAIAATEHAA